MKKNVHEIEIKLEGKDWEKCLDNSFKKNSKDRAVDGFRKGTVPKDIYIKNFGIESLYPDAVNEAINVAYKKLMDENDLVPVIEPAVDVTGLSDTTVIFKFVVITKPEIKLGDYKNLGVKRKKATANKEEVDAEVKILKNQLADIIVKDNGEIVNGDTAIINFDGYVDGKALDGGKGENFPLEIGSKTFIPGFEEGLLGHKTGDEFELNLKFPEDYVEDLKNKEVTFKVKVNEIKTRVEPEVNEEFFKDLGYEDMKTEEEFLKEVKKTIIERKEKDLEDEFIEELLNKASEKMEVDINEEIIDEEVHRMMHGYEEQLKMQGLSLEQYYEFTKTTHDDLHKQMEPEAIKRVKYRYLIEEIADKEKIDFTEKEVDEKAKEMAENYGISVEELISAYGSKEIVKYDMKMHRALEILKENNEK